MHRRRRRSAVGERQSVYRGEQPAAPRASRAATLRLAPALHFTPGMTDFDDFQTIDIDLLSNISGGDGGTAPQPQPQPQPQPGSQTGPYQNAATCARIGTAVGGPAVGAAAGALCGVLSPTPAY